MFLNHLKNPFLNAQLSETNFGKLASIHLELLKANNVHTGYTDLIAATEPLYGSFIHALSSGSGSSSIKGSKTMRSNEAIAQLKQFISRKEGVIADLFPRKSSTYQEFFPAGLMEYRLGTKANLQPLTERFIQAAHTYQNVIGNHIAIEAQQLLDTYLSSRTEQLQAMGNVKGMSEDGKTKRKALAVQMYKNLLRILLENADNPDYAKAYYDVSFVRKARKETKEEQVA